MWPRQSRGPSTKEENTKTETTVTINLLIFNHINLCFSLNLNVTTGDDTVSKTKLVSFTRPYCERTVIEGSPHSYEMYLQELDQVPIVNTGGKSPCASIRSEKVSFQNVPEHPVLLNKA